MSKLDAHKITIKRQLAGHEGLNTVILVVVDFTTLKAKEDSYGTSDVGVSPVSLREFDELKISAGFTEEYRRYLLLAGEILADQTKQLIDHWRIRLIGAIPNLARHTRRPDGSPIPKYAVDSGLRFQQWILDTCRRTYDQDWLNYQQSNRADGNQRLGSAKMARTRAQKFRRS